MQWRALGFSWMVTRLLLAPCAVAGPTTHPTGKVWHLTNYLNGTADQIRKALDTDVSRLHQTIPQIQRELRSYQKTLAEDTKIETGRLKTTAEYRTIKAEIAQAANNVVDAQNGRDTKAETEARQEYAKLKLKLSEYEAESLEDNETLSLDQRRVNEDLHELDESRKSLKQAEEWRKKLIDATRQSLLMPGPAGVGSTGIIGQVKIVKIFDKSSVMVRYLAPELLEEDSKDGGEGIVSTHVLLHPTQILLMIPIAGMREGEDRYVDRDFEITSTIDVGDDVALVAKVRDSDQDELIRALTR